MLINEAWAQSGAPGGADLWSMMPIILMFIVLYFMMIRPQMKRAKEMKAMIDSLQNQQDQRQLHYAANRGQRRNSRAASRGAVGAAQRHD